MPDLRIRNMPEHIYDKLKRHAERDNCSVSAENVRLLEQFFEREEAREPHHQVMRRIIERSKQKHPLASTSLPLLREDRDR